MTKCMFDGCITILAEGNKNPHCFAHTRRYMGIKFEEEEEQARWKQRKDVGGIRKRNSEKALEDNIQIVKDRARFIEEKNGLNQTRKGLTDVDNKVCTESDEVRGRSEGSEHSSGDGGFEGGEQTARREPVQVDPVHLTGGKAGNTGKVVDMDDEVRGIEEKCTYQGILDRLIKDGFSLDEIAYDEGCKVVISGVRELARGLVEKKERKDD